MNDKYDEQIAELTANPDLIESHWGCAMGIFQMAGVRSTPGYCRVGCLTMIRQGSYVAQTQELTKAILADERIPDDSAKITVEHLPVFAEWQRRLDIELGLGRE